jgi:ATP-binding cassette, subfamily B, bacterial HlyB/CyaB
MSGIVRSDAGPEALLLLLRFHGIAVDATQITHRLAGAEIGIDEMLRCAKEFKLRARAIATDWTHLKKLQLPAIAEHKDGAFVILGKLAEESVLVQPPGGRPEILSRSQFEAEWTGRLLLMARRASLGDLARRFDITWLLQAMQAATCCAQRSSASRISAAY